MGLYGKVRHVRHASCASGKEKTGAGMAWLWKVGEMDDGEETVRIRLMQCGWLNDDVAMRAMLIEVLAQAHEDTGATLAVPMLRDDRRLRPAHFSGTGAIRGAIGLLYNDEKTSLSGVKAMLRRCRRMDDGTVLVVESLCRA